MRLELEASREILPDEAAFPLPPAWAALLAPNAYTGQPPVSKRFPLGSG